ncbi:MAG: NFACT family protein [Alicyclobacillus macrosporangiidus]|uniref:Rqc2 family fibronectin-binding protein n=1 Tax=Alicyclobacillus macrosporangiidus TaxID=392015 RepID=UPI0026ED6D7B|nr:NFACT family protein [Alicyclobacillus macrosporangiidus]MCL6598322.1 NFACT family protein [Alicyclobacillus macrosporangiidus]
MDGLALAVLCADWNERFARARIEKIHQPGEREIVLTLRTRTGVHRVLLSAHRALARVHELVHARPANPEEPPMFCMMLRKRLEGGRITAIHQQGWDRVLEVHVEAVTEIGDRVQYAIVCEMMGKHSNLMLVEADESGRLGRIVDSVVHVGADLSRVRQVLPGLPYQPAPPLTRKVYDEVAEADIAALDLDALDAKRRSRALAGLVAGAGTVTAAEVLFRAGGCDPAGVTAALREVFTAALGRREPATLGLDDLGWPVAAAPFRLTHCAGHEAVPNLDEAMDRLYAKVLERGQTSRVAQALARDVEKQLDRLRAKIANLEQQRTEALDHDALRVRGELLLSYPHLVPRGAREVTLPNFYADGAPLTISLDPALTAIENAQRYFHQASRKKRAIPRVEAELTQARQDLRYLEEILLYVEGARPEELAAIRRELTQQGFLKARRARPGAGGRPRDGAPGYPDAYESSDGLVIRVGRNHAQNDRLTLRQSHPQDVWLHAKDLPGSHVVIQLGGRELPETTLHEAALLAAYFSRGREAGTVAVDYTRIKHVWKPNGARPGFVLYDHQKTLYVHPERHRIEAILGRRIERRG